MDYKTNWKDFLKYDENGKRIMDFPSYVVDTAPGKKSYMYHGEYMAMLAAEKAVKNARRAAREAELIASRPNSIDSPVTPTDVASGSEVPASLHPASLPRRSKSSSPSSHATFVPDLERHSRRCLICSHPDRDAIEGEFIRWRSPHKIARDYALSDRATVYRHAHATHLFEERRRHVGRVLESFLETIDDNPPADFDPVTRAIRVYAHLSTHGDWFEPLRKVHITTSHIHTSHAEPDVELEIEADPQAERANEPDEETRVPVGTTEGSPARECWEDKRPEPLTSGPELWDRPSRESAEGCPSPLTNNEAQNLASREGEAQLRLRPSVAVEEKALGSVAANRHNPKVENLPNPHQTNDIAKLNRNKKVESASPEVR